MSERIFLEQNTQDILNIVEALQFYKDNVIKPKYRNLIDEQLNKIGQQLKLQNVNILFENSESRFNFGDLIRYENGDAIIVGMSDEDHFIKISVIENSQFKIIEVPICLIERKNNGTEII